MSRTVLEEKTPPAVEETDRSFDRLISAAVEKRPADEPGPAGVRIGSLVAFTDNGATPLVTFPGQRGTAALRARMTTDLHGAHVGRPVVLVFENADLDLPVIVGCVRDDSRASAPDAPGRVEIDADGERMIVSAKEQLVLRCGQASITLTKAGKILVHGTYVSNRSSGVLRLKGGSVQIN